jgi:hypothetical protein
LSDDELVWDEETYSFSKQRKITDIFSATTGPTQKTPSTGPSAPLPRKLIGSPAASSKRVQRKLADLWGK